MSEPPEYRPIEVGTIGGRTLVVDPLVGVPALLEPDPWFAVRCLSDLEFDPEDPPNPRCDLWLRGAPGAHEPDHVCDWSSGVSSAVASIQAFALAHDASYPGWPMPTGPQSAEKMRQWHSRLAKDADREIVEHARRTGETEEWVRQYEQAAAAADEAYCAEHFRPVGGRDVPDVLLGFALHRRADTWEFWLLAPVERDDGALPRIYWVQRPCLLVAEGDLWDPLYEREKKRVKRWYDHTRLYKRLHGPAPGTRARANTGEELIQAVAGVLRVIRAEADDKVAVAEEAVRQATPGRGRKAENALALARAKRAEAENPDRQAVAAALIWSVDSLDDLRAKRGFPTWDSLVKEATKLL